MHGVRRTFVCSCVLCGEGMRETDSVLGGLWQQAGALQLYAQVSGACMHTPAQANCYE